MKSSSLIKDIPLEDRPRERLLKYGAASISNEELLAIILHTGTHNTSVKDVSSAIIKKYGGIRGLKNATIHSLCQIKGISTAKSIAILAAIELGVRVNETDIIAKDVKITNSIDAYKYFSKYIVRKERENFMAIFLDNQQRYITHKIIFKGTINKAEIHEREVLKEALLENSNKLIIMHNHPSGIVKPSASDDEVTRRIAASLSLIDAHLIDHIIVGNNDYYSYLEEGRIRYE